MQLEPTKYNKGMLDAFKQVVRAEGVGVLATGASSQLILLSYILLT